MKTRAHWEDGRVPQRRRRRVGRLHLPGGQTVLRSLMLQAHHSLVDQLDRDGFPIAFGHRNSTF